MTGAEFSQIFDRKQDKAYSGFINNTKKTFLFREALLKSVEDKYRKGLDTQKELDEIDSFIKTEKIFGVNNSQIYTTSIQITNITNVGTTVTVTTSLPHNLIVGQSVTLSGVQGIVSTPGINNTFIVATTPSSTTFTFVVTAIVNAYVSNSGLITYSNMITDYMHLLAIKSKYAVPLYDLNIIGATNTSPIVITVDDYNSIRSTEQFTISGVLGNTNANGTFFFKKVQGKKFALYSDANFQSPVAGNGQYSSGGSISKTFYNYCTPLASDEKVSVYGEPTVDLPKFEKADKSIKLYPSSPAASEITIDYISKEIVQIDPANSVIDLEQYYPAKFLYYVADKACLIFAEEIKDSELYQTSQVETKQNP